MKKSLIAVATLGALSGVAHADDSTSVTLYGIIDAGVATTSNVLGAKKTATAPAIQGTVTGVESGGLATSRWGLRGVEDLGGGTKAKFLLESELLPQIGSNGASDPSTTTYTQLFKRGAWVGVGQDGIGEIRVGRQNTANYDYATSKYDAFRAGNVGSLSSYVDSTPAAEGSGNVFNTYGVDRTDNTLELRSADWSGFTLRIARAFGNVAGSATAGSTTDLGGEYQIGKFSAAVAYLTRNANIAATNTTGANTSSATTNLQAFAFYDFDVVAVNAGYAKTKGKLNAEGAAFDTEFVGARVPVLEHTTLIGQFAIFQNHQGTTETKPKVVSAGVQYDLSKRTAVYGLIAYAKQDGTSQVNTVTGKFTNLTASGGIAGGETPVPGDNQHTIMIGINHKF